MEVVRQILTIFMLIVSVVLNVVILMQQSKETGLGSVFGGGDTSSLSLKGKSATKEAKLRKITVILAIILGLFALIMVALPA